MAVWCFANHWLIGGPIIVGTESILIETGILVQIDFPFLMFTCFMNTQQSNSQSFGNRL